MGVLNLYKKLGMTPLEAILEFKEKNPEYVDVKMTYAGRLDPMAEGVLLVLVGDEIKEKDKYLKLNKVYEADVLFGFESDTGDVLGMVKKACAWYDACQVGDGDKNKKEQEIKAELKKIVGDFKFRLPAYSSYKIKGKSLFHWAKKGELDENEIPERSVKIFEVDLKNTYLIKGAKLLKNVLAKIDLVKGDFRQDEIKKKWASELASLGGVDFLVAGITVSCSSGTYIRALAGELGKNLGTSALLLNLKRTKVGEFEVVIQQNLRENNISTFLRM